MKGIVILSDQEVRLKINRVAYQIYEDNMDESEVYIAGIDTRGYRMAEMIAEKVSSICHLKVHLCKMGIDRSQEIPTFSMECPIENLNGKCVILVDDVLNTGAVLIHAVRYLLSENLKKLNTAVLIDRNHKRFPVKVDYKGLSLSTSLHEEVKVRWLEDGTMSVEYVQ